MKFGWGPFGQDLSQDLAHVEAARQSAGNSRDLMVDAGQAFQVQAALERARLLQQFDIGWLEEPLSQDDLRGYAELCAASPVPIAAGEGEVTRWGFEDLMECGLHVLQPDVAICGGLTVAGRFRSWLAPRNEDVFRIASARESTWPLRYIGWPLSVPRMRLSSIAFVLRR